MALITGAARGQGRSHAVGLAREGADVIALDACSDIESVGYPLASEADLDATAEAVRHLGRRCLTTVVDVRDAEGLDRAVADGIEDMGRLDVVVVNAGILSPSPALTMSPQVWQQTIDVNLTGAWNTCRSVIGPMVEQGSGGAIVLTSSVAGLRGLTNMVNYTAAKHGVVGIMKALAQELAPHRIRVNSVHPTSVETPMIINQGVYELFSPDGDPTTARDKLAEAMTPLHPLGSVPWIQPQDVTNAVIFLVTDESRYITGVSLPIDAGNLLI